MWTGFKAYLDWFEEELQHSVWLSFGKFFIIILNVFPFMFVFSFFYASSASALPHNMLTPCYLLFQQLPLHTLLSACARQHTYLCNQKSNRLQLWNLLSVKCIGIMPHYDRTTSQLLYLNQFPTDKSKISYFISTQAFIWWDRHIKD